MFFWSSFVDLLRVVLFALAHVCGGSLGGGIIMLSFIIRLALLPLTLRLAMRARDYQDAIRRLGPELEKLRRRHANDRVRLAQATQERLALLYNSQGLRPAEIAGKLGVSTYLATQIILAARNRPTQRG